MKFLLNNSFFIAIIFILVSGFSTFAQDSTAIDLNETGARQSTPNIMQLTAKTISEDALKKGNITNAIAYTKEKLASTDELSDKAEIRSLYIFLGGLQEGNGLYSDAKSSYIKAAAIAGKDAPGMKARSNEMLVLDATRMALATGEGNEAMSFLASAVKNSRDPYIQSLVKLYNIWAMLCLEQTEAKEKECIKTLKQYATMDSMKNVRLYVLFTLWYITGETSYGEQIINLAPLSTESSIVQGVTQIMPSPFWYFIPHNRINTIAKANTSVESDSTKTTKTVVTVKTINAGPNNIPGYVAPDSGYTPGATTKTQNEDDTDEVDSSEKPIKQQLGLFRDKNNALGYAEKLQSKGFPAYISEVTKPSGKIYYTVFVDEDNKGGMGLKLKSAGFECYPIYKQ